jgi:DNA primase
MSRIPDELVEEVRAALRQRIEDVFEACGAELRGRGRNRRTGTCPACGDRSRWDAVRVSVDRGWKCACCNAGGDAVKALALFTKLDPRTDFAEVIRRGADVLGIDLEPAADPAVAAKRRRQLAQQRAGRERARAERDRMEAIERAHAIEQARRGWLALYTEHPAGEAYLRSRGITLDDLPAGAIAFGRTGTPAVALYDEDGALVNIVRRSLTADGPKTPGLLHCPSEGTLVGRVTDVAAGSLVVIAEGVIDTLTACLAWPGAVVLGAHGAGNYGDTAGMAARALVAAGGGRLLVCLDNDHAGRGAGAEAVEAVRDAGLDLTTAEVVDIGDHHDLNDAWCAGWRP